MSNFNVKAELEHLRKDFSELLTLIEHSNLDISQVSTKYSDLKLKVAHRLKTLQEAEKSNKLSPIERHFLLPAIREVRIHCSARIGSQDPEQLISSIYDCEDYCSSWLSKLDL
ncbi:hypothetical protein DX885_000855 [Vibrio mimicus]